MNRINLSLAIAATCLAMPLAAQDTPPTETATPAPAAPLQIDQGATVYGSAGAEIGKVASVSGETVVVDTGTHRVGLNRSTFAPGSSGLTIQMTREELDSAAESAERDHRAKVDAALIAGAAVKSSDGQDLGTIKSINPDGSVTVQGPGKAKPFSLRKDLFTLDPTGAVVVAVTAKDLAEAQAKPAGK